jgi:hypothetical protein
VNTKNVGIAQWFVTAAFQTRADGWGGFAFTLAWFTPADSSLSHKIEWGADEHGFCGFSRIIKKSAKIRRIRLYPRSS